MPKSKPNKSAPRNGASKRPSVREQRVARPLTLSGRCILGHQQTLTEAQIEEARSLGCAMCSTCGNAVIVAGGAA